MSTLFQSLRTSSIAVSTNLGNGPLPVPQCPIILVYLRVLLLHLCNIWTYHTPKIPCYFYRPVCFSSTLFTVPTMQPAGRWWFASQHPSWSLLRWISIVFSLGLCHWRRPYSSPGETRANTLQSIGHHRQDTCQLMPSYHRDFLTYPLSFPHKSLGTLSLGKGGGRVGKGDLHTMPTWTARTVPWCKEEEPETTKWDRFIAAQTNVIKNLQDARKMSCS